MTDVKPMWLIKIDSFQTNELSECVCSSVCQSVLSINSVLTYAPLLLYLQVQITLLDKNDSPPKFGSDLFELSVPENSEPGHIVSTVVAMDADETGTVTYTIKDGAEKKFDIDPLKGEKIHV